MDPSDLSPKLRTSKIYVLDKITWYVCTYALFLANE